MNTAHAQKNNVRERVREQVSTRIKRIHANIRALERSAGLSVGSINNILHNSSNPTAETLDALADVLGCSTDELLGRGIPTRDINEAKLDNSLSDLSKFEWNYTLFNSIVSAVNKIFTKKNLTPTAQEAVTISLKIFLYLLKKGQDSFDELLIEWIIDESKNSR